MNLVKIKPAKYIAGKIYLPADKSICHRAVILSCLSPAKTIISNFSSNQDCNATIKTFVQLGIKIKKQKIKRNIYRIFIYGKGLYGLRPSKRPLYMGESGTSMRLIAGVLAGQRFNSYLIASSSLNRRPMRRITQPLRLMGADINSKIRAAASTQEEYPPLTIQGKNLKAIRYRLPIPSAQVKSAILLAGLYAKGKTFVIEPIKSRDHTEKMLKLFGADISFKGLRISIKHKELRSPGMVRIPGDISSAAFFIVGACILKGSQITIKSVGLNPTRTGLLRILKRMGAEIQTTEHRLQTTDIEPVGDIIVKGSQLKGVVVKAEEIPSLIDELPILMVAACFAKGKTVIDGIQELRVKETDRISSMVNNLKRMGANIKSVSCCSRGKVKERLIIKGVGLLNGASLDSFGDHRTAMSLIIASLGAQGESTLSGIEAIKKSFPDFLDTLSGLIVRRKF